MNRRDLNQLESRLQELGDLCLETLGQIMQEEIAIGGNHTAEWLAVSSKLDDLFDEMRPLRDRCVVLEPPPVERPKSPIFGVGKRAGRYAY